jgi:hypothetical protein
MRVLVLNASFEPINVCTERRAVVMIFKGRRAWKAQRPMLHPQSRNARAVYHPLDQYRHIPFERRSLAEEHSAARPFLLPVLRQTVCTV